MKNCGELFSIPCDHLEFVYKFIFLQLFLAGNSHLSITKNKATENLKRQKATFWISATS